MAFILKIGNFVELPIRLEINDGSKPAIFNFKLTAKRLSVSEWEKHFSTDGEHAGQPVRDFLLDHITGWTGQGLVIDEGTGQPAEFNRESFTAMLSVMGVQPVVFQKYVEAIASAASKDGKAKN